MTETHHIKTPDELMALLRRSNEVWRRGGGDPGWVFRGNSKPCGLVPSALRSSVQRTRADSDLLNAYVGQMSEKHRITDWAKWIGSVAGDANSGVCLDDVAVEALAHVTLVSHFGLPAKGVLLYADTPEFAWHIANADHDYFAKYFRGELIHELFALAQHHRIPTVLLDWTFNPFAAAFFAASGAHRHGDTEGIEIWALSWEYLNEPKAKVKRVTVRPGVSPFLDAQEGLFTWQPDAYLEKLRCGGYSRQEELITEDAKIHRLAPPLMRIT